MTEHRLTIERVSEWLRYEPETGDLYWIKSRSWRTPVGSRVDGRSGGYRNVYLLGRVYGAHRIAFLFAFGRWPEGDIDHINGDRRDNRPQNLREATKKENARNRRAKVKFKGTYFRKSRQRWISGIWVEGRNVYLGSFETPEEAQAAYAAAAIAHFGEFARAS